jgi:PAS domain S-box-containing protein
MYRAWELVHRIAGSAGTFGAPEVGDLARTIYDLLDATLREEPGDYGAGDSGDGSENPPQTPAIRRISVLFDRLRIEARSLQLSSKTAHGEESQPQPTSSETEPPEIYVAEDDEELKYAVSQAAERLGYRVRSFSSLQDFMDAAVVEPEPAAVVLDVIFAGEEQDGLEALSLLRDSGWTNVPVVVSSIRTDAKARLEAFRAGGTRYLPKPYRIDTLMGLIQQLAPLPEETSYRIMLVAPEREEFRAVADAFAGAEFELEWLDDPETLFARVHRFQPELMIADLDGEEWNGVEIAAMLRSDPAFQYLPACFLSRDSQNWSRVAEMRVGENEFFTKDADLQNVVHTAVVRARRHRYIESMKRDLQRFSHHHQDLFHAMSEHTMIAVLDTEGYVLEANDNFSHTTGFSRQELLDSSSTLFDHALLAPTEPSQQRAVGEALRNGRTWRGEIAARRHDGNTIWLDSTIVPLLDERGSVYQYVAVQTDITELRRANDVLERLHRISTDESKETGERIEAALAVGRDTIGLSDGLVSRIEGETYHVDTAVGDEATALLASDLPLEETYCAQPWASQRAFGVNHASQSTLSDAPSYARFGLEAYLGVPFYVFGRKYGTVCFFNRRPVAPFTDSDFIILRLISEWIGAQIALRDSIAKLRESEERYRRGQIFANIGVWELEVATETLYVSETIDTYFGFPEFVPTTTLATFLEYVPHAERQRIRQALDASVREGASIDVEHRLARADGTAIWVHEMGDIVYDSNGSPERILGAVQDVTARKEAEQALIEARDMAEAASNAKSEFLSSMSHELRTPMNAILGFAQLLETDSEHPLSEEQLGSVREILNGGQHLLALINDILDLARIDSGRIDLSMENVLMREVLEESVTLIQPQAQERGITVSIEANDRCAQTVHADRVRLKQVMLNLLSNGVKYNKPKGRVRIRCEHDEGFLRIEIADTGHGIPQEQQQELFEAFNRLGREQSEIEGTGIGLVISKRLVEMMGGEIGFSSQVGAGSTFWFTAPLGQKQNPDAHAQSVHAAADLEPSEASRTVLYIEDNPSNLRLVSRLLRTRETVRLLTAQTGKLGVQLAEAHQPDLVLLDMHLPDTDALEILDTLRGEASRPVLILSADAGAQTVRKAREAGASEFLTKPLDVSSFYTTLDAYLFGER